MSEVYLNSCACHLEIKKLKQELERVKSERDEAVKLISTMKDNMEYIEPEYDELDIKIKSFMAKLNKENKDENRTK